MLLVGFNTMQFIIFSKDILLLVEILFTHQSLIFLNK